MLTPKRSYSSGRRHIYQQAEKLKQTLSTRQLTASVILERKGELMVELMQQWFTTKSEVYCKTQRYCIGQLGTNGMGC
jgi:hypothetical protein